MSVESELAGYVSPPGVQCRIKRLETTHPDGYRDLMEALATTHPGAAIARWWNDTREEATGVSLNENTAQRHRGRRCVQCR